MKKVYQIWGWAASGNFEFHLQPLEEFESLEEAKKAFSTTRKPHVIEGDYTTAAAAKPHYTIQNIAPGKWQATPTNLTHIQEAWVSE